MPPTTAQAPADSKRAQEGNASGQTGPAFPQTKTGRVDTSCRYYVAGHQGMAGAAVVRALRRQGCERILAASHRELDLTNQAATQAWFLEHRPEVVILAAAREGGDRAAQASFLYDNLMIEANVVEAARLAGARRVLFLAAPCVYPRLAPQPIREHALLSGPPEKAEEGCAVAKIAGLKLCELYRRQFGLCCHALMPANLYGPGDHYDLASGRVLPVMIRKFEQARAERNPFVDLPGSGSPLRDFLHVDDLAEACLCALALENPPDLMNVSSGREVTLRWLAETVKAATGSTAEIRWDGTKPDGAPRKLCDSSLIRSLGWMPRIRLEDGIRSTVDAYRVAVATGAVRLD